MFVRAQWTCLLVTLVTTASLAGQSGFSPNETVKTGNGKLAAAVAKQDAAAIASLYAADAEAQPRGGEAIKGRAAIQKMWEGLLARGAASFALTTGDADFANGAITERGTFVMKKKDGSVFSRGTYQNVWKKEAGVWKIQSNTWTDAPPR